MKWLSMIASSMALLLATEVEAVQSDLVKVCVDNKGRKTPVRYIAGRQTCGNLKTLSLDRPAYGVADFSGTASDELDECTVLDGAFPDDIALCLGLQEIGPEGEQVEVCSVWLDGANEYLVASDGTEPAGFLATPEGNNIFASAPAMPL